MKQITVVLHFENDVEAQAFYARLRALRRDNGDEVEAFNIRGGRDSIRELKLLGPNDSKS